MKFNIKYIDAEEFIDTLEKLDSKLELKVVKELLVVQEHGFKYLESRPLRKGIFELKTKVGSTSFRTLYFYDKVNRSFIIITGGFVKKTKKTPKNILDNAIERKKRYEKERVFED